MSDTIYYIVLIICIILSSCFSASEMALAKVNKLKLKRDIEDGKKYVSLADKFANDYGSAVSTILLGNNLVNIAASSIATILFVNKFSNNGELYVTIIMTLIILTFGEITPKSIAGTFPYNLSILLSYLLQVFKIIFTPLVFVNKKLVAFIEKVFTKKEENNENLDDELINMVDSMEAQGVINEDTQELITNAIEFVDVDANEIMVHRVDVFGFNINDNINELLTNKDLFNYSRIPVYDESIDNIVGVLNTKQLIKLHLNGNKIDINELLTDPLYVFETQSISSILKAFKEKHIHMAIVKDEFGGTSGILTLEDILEELVGDILDEKDKIEEAEYHVVNKNRFTIDGEMNLYDFFDLINYDYEADNFNSQYVTVSGWIVDNLEKFPEVDDSFTFNNYEITVMKADDFTVLRARCKKLKEDKLEETNE